MEAQVTAEIQRALGRIEGAQKEMSEAQKKIFLMVEQLGKDLADHKGEDRQNFQIMSSRTGNLETTVKNQRDEELNDHESRDKSISKVQADLESLNNYVENIKGAWWLITIIGVLVASFGALVTWFITMWNARHGG